LIQRYFIPLIISLVSILPAGCSLIEKSDNKKEPVARVFDTYLYRSELAEVIPEESSSQDSIVISKSYIDTWIRNQLMLNRAEVALTEEQKDVEKKIEEYRSSLLIYSYRQKLLQQKLDTTVKAAEIRDYYENNVNNFILSDVIVKASFVKVPLSAPNIARVRSWSRSGEPEDLDNLEKYSINYAEKFDMFDNSWVYFKNLMEQVPLKISQPDRFLRYNRNIETSDSLYHYFVHIQEYKTEGDVKPIELVRNDIRSILLNKRKIQFYNNLENQVYNDGANRNQFEIY